MLKILRDAPLHLRKHGVLICEVGESQQHLERLLPDVPFAWIEFKVGQMGVFALHHDDLVAHHAEIARLASQRP